ncbi:hypothetical protein BDZ97DRAFT_2081227 [Flammula alnicola]|nr:hypothetical protein BDZ97DRAFT_2081227 [Flammula alnicola]
MSLGAKRPDWTGLQNTNPARASALSSVQSGMPPPPTRPAHRDSSLPPVRSSQSQSSTSTKVGISSSSSRAYSRPSTAEGSPSVITSASGSSSGGSRDRAEVTPWEFQSLIEERDDAGADAGKEKDKEDREDRQYGITKEVAVGYERDRAARARSMTTTTTAPSVRSRSSSAALRLGTGPVEEVTPWEVQALPEEVEDVGVGVGAAEEGLRMENGRTDKGHVVEVGSAADHFSLVFTMCISSSNILHC